MIYADFESVLIPGDNGKQNTDESYVQKYQKDDSCNYGYKLVCVDDKFSIPLNSSEDAVYSFINSIIKEIKYCSDSMIILYIKL